MGTQRVVELTDESAQTSAAVLAWSDSADVVRTGLVTVLLLVGLLAAVSYPAVAAGVLGGLVVGTAARLVE